jgi:acetyl-CoA carboxylase alpha subunit
MFHQPSMNHPSSVVVGGGGGGGARALTIAHVIT